MVNGYDVTKHPEEVRACLGYMPDFFGVYTDMKVWEYLDFFAAAYRVPRGKRPGLISDVLELTDLTYKRDEYVETLSRGMQQRLCLAKTLVHDPDILLLDEPASGLDPRARIEIRELLQELCRMKKTILISSHILPELAELCSKVAIIEAGKLVMAGSVAEISNATRRRGEAGHPPALPRRRSAARSLCVGRISSPPTIVEGEVEAIYRGQPERPAPAARRAGGRGLPGAVVLRARDEPGDALHAGDQGDRVMRSDLEAGLYRRFASTRAWVFTSCGCACEASARLLGALHLRRIAAVVFLLGDVGHRLGKRHRRSAEPPIGTWAAGSSW